VVQTAALGSMQQCPSPIAEPEPVVIGRATLRALPPPSPFSPRSLEVADHVGFRFLNDCFSIRENPFDVVWSRFGFVFYRWARQGLGDERTVDHRPLEVRAVFGAAPGLLRREPEHAQASDFTVVVGAALEVAAVLTHRHHRRFPQWRLKPRCPALVRARRTSRSRVSVSRPAFWGHDPRRHCCVSAKRTHRVLCRRACRGCEPSQSTYFGRRESLIPLRAAVREAARRLNATVPFTRQGPCAIPRSGRKTPGDTYGVPVQQCVEGTAA
jgi:hypothetical protein